MLSFFPRGVLDEILNLIESVSEGFPSYSAIYNSPNAATSNKTMEATSRNSSKLETKESHKTVLCTYRKHSITFVTFSLDSAKSIYHKQILTTEILYFFGYHYYDYKTDVFPFKTIPKI